MSKFQCIKCGNCCKSFKPDPGNFPDFLNNSNMISFSAPRLLIFDWEKEYFPENTLQLGYCFFDLKNNQTIILNYNLNKDICPNLKDNLCSTHKNRPLACIHYPCPIKDVKDFNNLQSAHGVCLAELSLEELKQELNANSTQEIRKNIYNRYENAFIQGIASDLILETYVKFIASLDKQGIIKLAKPGYPIEFIKKRIEQSEKINISKLFLKHTNQEPYKMILSDQGIARITDNIKNM